MELNTAQKIFRLRKARKWSQSRLASEMGVKQPRISEIENGYIPGAKMLYRLATVFKVDVKDLSV